MSKQVWSIVIFYVILLVALLSSVSAKADTVNPETWANNTEYMLYTAITADYLQTRQIRKRDDLYEKNAFFCGRKPSETCTLLWFGAKLYGVYWLNNKAGLTPMRRYKTNVFLFTWTAKVVHSNLELGLEIRF